MRPVYEVSTHQLSLLKGINILISQIFASFVLLSSLQVSCLFIKIQSTITAMLVGLFDVSTVTQQIVKVG